MDLHNFQIDFKPHTSQARAMNFTSSLLLLPNINGAFLYWVMMDRVGGNGCTYKVFNPILHL